jgi:hypothetical protein
MSILNKYFFHKQDNMRKTSSRKFPSAIFIATQSIRLLTIGSYLSIWETIKNEDLSEKFTILGLSKL